MEQPHAERQARFSYVVGPIYDWIFFLLPPVLALGLGWSITGTTFAEETFDFWGYEVAASEVAIGIFIHAHVVLVLFRSHGNRGIFRRHPFRFLGVPVLLYAALVSSTSLLSIASVLAALWDVYHSGLQTFGFGRLYDRKHGNDPQVGRRLDWWLNQVLYAGPVIAGVTMLDHLESLEGFVGAGAVFFTAIPAFVESRHVYLTWAVIGAGTLFIAYYAFAQWRLHVQGFRVSPLKVYLFASTGLCSIYTWGFNSWGEAFFIMNFFHALQYFGLVWATEHENLTRVLRVSAFRAGKAVTAIVFLALPAAYGYWVEALDTDFTRLWAITLVVSLMHFWYDGFIWSVSRNQI